MAQAFGFASSAQVDLPANEQTVGSFADRELRLARWKTARKAYCADARRGYPEIKNRTDRAYLTRLASENCTDGWRYRAGDNADMAIGQGETTVSPLQLAVAYSALVNGGTVYKPTLGWAEVNPAGKVVHTIKAQVKSKVPVSKKVLAYIKNSLHFVDGAPITGAGAFLGSPIKTEISGKTGTAEVYGKQTTSWLATWGPTPKAKFVVVSMIEQAGTGGGAAGPLSLRDLERPARRRPTRSASRLHAGIDVAEGRPRTRCPSPLPNLPTKHRPSSSSPATRPTYDRAPPRRAGRARAQRARRRPRPPRRRRAPRPRRPGRTAPRLRSRTGAGSTSAPARRTSSRAPPSTPARVTSTPSATRTTARPAAGSTARSSATTRHAPVRSSR